MRKYLLVVIVVLPLLVFAQQKRTVVITQDNYGHDLLHNLFHHLTSPFQFIGRMFNKQTNFVNRLHDKLSFTLGRPSGFSFHSPVIINEDRIILNNNNNVIILPKKEPFINDNRGGTIIKKNGRSIYIQKDRRS